MRTWNKRHHGAIHLYGHSHGTLPGDAQSCDVGVDCWDFYPVSLAQIKARLAESPPIEPVDHHGTNPDAA
jgi:calcineurin-like phosphoesterase family protein